MKKLIILGFLFQILTSCNGDITNERIALYVKSDGLNPIKVNAYANQIIKNDKYIKYGQELTIEILGIDDFELSKEGQVYPGGENSLVDEDNNVLYFVEDYFKRYDIVGVRPQDAENLKFNLTIGKPMEPGKKYHFLFRLWDKRSERELKGNIELNVR